MPEEKALQKLKAKETTVILYESPHRILKTLEAIKEIYQDKNIFIARELTKKFQETYQASAEKAISFFENKKPKGEFVIII